MDNYKELIERLNHYADFYSGESIEYEQAAASRGRRDDNAAD